MCKFTTIARKRQTLAILNNGRSSSHSSVMGKAGTLRLLQNVTIHSRRSVLALPTQSKSPFRVTEWPFRVTECAFRVTERRYCRPERAAELYRAYFYLAALTGRTALIHIHSPRVTLLRNSALGYVQLPLQGAAIAEIVTKNFLI